jgi:hypothetical protein
MDGCLVAKQDLSLRADWPHIFLSHSMWIDSNQKL